MDYFVIYQDSNPMFNLFGKYKFLGLKI